MDQLEKKYGVEIYHHLHIGDTVNEYHTNLDGCGYVVAKDDVRVNAEEKVNKTLMSIKSTIF
jgi:hypothetical protein